MPIEIPTTEIPKHPSYSDELLKLLIEEQRLVIAALIEIRDKMG